MIDSLKTMAISITGMGVTWIEWLPVVVRVLVGLASLVYLFIKIHNELKKQDCMNKDKGVVKRVFVTPDKHFPLHDKKAISVVKKAIEIVKPDVYVDL